MNISTISANQTSTTSSAQETDNSKLTLKTFITLLVAQMQHQDPSEPMKDSDYMSQITNLGTLQGLDQLNKTQNIAQATSMIGKTVTAVKTRGTSSTSADQFITGTVTSVNMRNSKYYLTIKSSNNTSSEVEMGNVQTVS